jgi:nucleoside-diphosphate-sugar epimerase
MLALLPIYADTEQIERQRQDYAHRLRDLAQNLSFGDAAMLAQAEPLIGNAGPFWLPYQNRDDRELQATYGAMIARIVQAPPPRLKLPAWPFQLAGSACERICKPLGIDPPIYRRRVDFFTKSRAFTIEKARRVLGYEPQVPLEVGLARTAAWYREHGYLPAAASAA